MIIMIFDLMLEATSTERTKIVASDLDKLFNKLGANPNDYIWQVLDIEDEEEARAVGLRNLFIAAQDKNMLPDFVNVDDDFYFDDTDVILNVEGYEGDEVRRIRDAALELEKLLGLTIKIED